MAHSPRARHPLALLSVAVASAALLVLVPAAWGAVTVTADPFAPVDRALQRRVRRAGLSGATTVVAGPGDVKLHLAEIGSVHSHTRLPIASASKVLTSATIMALVDQGRLSLDDRVATYLPEFRDDKATMTVRQLLAHTSGLTEAACVGDPSGTLGECVTSMANDAVLAAPPGRAFHYSNDGYQVAGRIIEVITGTSFEHAFEALIGRPVGMTRTRFDRLDGVRTRNPEPASSAVSSMDDYLRFLSMMAADGLIGSRRVLSLAAVAEIERDQVHGLDTRDDPAVQITAIPTYGLGVWRDITDASDAAQVVSANGALGFYPWIDVVHHTYGIVAIDDPRGAAVAVPASQKVARLEWRIAAHSGLGAPESPSAR